VIEHTTFLHHRVVITLLLIAALGAIFLKGFKEAIGIAVILVGVYLVLNLAVVVVGFYEVFTHPTVVGDWRTVLFETYKNPFLMVGTALLIFPKLALGLSGFETGVVVMPLVKGEGTTASHIEPLHTTSSRSGLTASELQGRIHNTRKLLLSAALISLSLHNGRQHYRTTRRIEDRHSIYRGDRH
jgi:hypothetical protein